jgi:hypothetical protein
MSALRTLPPEASRILRLAAIDRPAARAAFSCRSVEEQVALLCEAPVARRAELLELAAAPEALIPALPPAELCHTVKAVGLTEAGWILEHANEEQIVTCLDLDAWRDFVPDRERIGEWLLALEDAGGDTLLRAVQALDTELLVLHLRSRIVLHLAANDDDFTPPVGSHTLDDQFHFVAIHEKDDLADLIALLRTLFERDYGLYFRLLHASMSEIGCDAEEWTLRWRSGRLQDLGFPPWEEAMCIYGRLREEQMAELPEAEREAQIGEWPLPVWMPSLPAASPESPSLLRALAELSAEERRPTLFAFLALVNRVAVADRLSLGDAETLPAATEKAVRIASHGLDFLVETHGMEAVAVLRRTSLERLFRVGASLPGFVERPKPAAS